MKYQISKKTGQCFFEEYNKAVKDMDHCGKVTRIKRGQKYVCLEHLKPTICMDKTVLMYDENKDIVRTKQNFLDLAEGLEI